MALILSSEKRDFLMELIDQVFRDIQELEDRILMEKKRKLDISDLVNEALIGYSDSSESVEIYTKKLLDLRKVIARSPKISGAKVTHLYDFANHWEDLNDPEEYLEQITAEIFCAKMNGSRKGRVTDCRLD